MSTASPATAAPASITREERRVLAGTLVGTTIEWYDFFIYAQAAGLILSVQYFGPLASDNPALGQIMAWASLGISFLFRPLGAIIAGHLGDRIGRKKMLVLTLILMGLATSLIGLLPNYAAIGIGAPILLTLLRILQGFSAGGEWGGAALLSVEHAPVNKRGLFGAYPQIGVPVGMILATGVIWILTTVLTTEQFASFGWRIPFLFSVVLVIVGYYIRRQVEESPIFAELAERKAESSAPLSTLFKKNTKEVILSALIFIGNNAVGYMIIAFFAAYASRPIDQGGTVGLDRAPVLLATTLASFGWLVFTMWGGALSDKLGRVRTFQIGYILLILWLVPTFLMIDTGSIWMYGIGIFVLTVGMGLSYGPMSAMYAEMFPPQVRYSGVSIGYALGAILGGAFAPTIAETLLARTGSSLSIAAYMIVVCIISLIAVSLVKETKGASLGIVKHTS
ncbi:MFS transporter [Brevibacterium aurantiacum]|uniref:Putative proline/betaine transporter n=1 Tax=Brevibacterium aurantiacum TaxID=273384 RepID=A0A2A3Z9P9_BREAU|nr:MFS transporter [Brevibacterium aurantiacum]PCC48243.1 MFS transporter [Brevibacterium aurantiacum]TGD38556.1 MFS transporter [Brevibacterium aurantiacum]